MYVLVVYIRIYTLYRQDSIAFDVLLLYEFDEY